MKNKDDIETYVFIFGQSFPRSELIRLGLIVFLIVLILTGGGIFFYLDWREQQLVRAEKSEEVSLTEEAAALEKAEMDPLKLFFQEYLALTQLDGVDSIRAVGVYDVEGVVMDFIFLAKRPRLYLQTLRQDSQEIKFGFDGTQVWFSQTDEQVDTTNADLMNLNRQLALLESAIPCLAWDYDPKGANTTFERMPDIVWEGNPCYVIKNTGLIERTPVYHYIDKVSGFERYRRASVQIAPRRFKDVELVYDEPLADSEYPLPSGMELLLDGRLYYNVNFTQVSVNMGIASFLFRIPGQ